MRKLGLLPALVFLLAFPSAALAAWGTPTPIQVSLAANGIDPAFDRVGNGILRNTGAGTYFANSADGGATWGATTQFGTGGSNHEVATDQNGNRVWAYAFSNKIRLVRTDKTGGPSSATPKEITVVGKTDLKIAVSPAGDALVAWSYNSGDAGVAYWKAGDPNPGAPQTLTAGCSSTASPTPILDPGGSATVVWTCALSGGKTYQATTADASQTNAFGAASQLAVGTVAGSGQAPDGRAILLVSETRSHAANSLGKTSTQILKYATRAAGNAFPAPADLIGDPEDLYAGGGVVISPTGRVLIGYLTDKNRPAGSYTACDVFGQGRSGVLTGTIDPSSGAVSFTTAALSNPGAQQGYLPLVAAGPDGRLAIFYTLGLSCGPPPINENHAQLAFNNGSFGAIDLPPMLTGGSTQIEFNAFGSLYALGYIGGVLNGVAFETTVQLTPPGYVEPTPPAGGGSSDPPVANPPAKVAPIAAIVILAKAKASKGGKATIKVGVNGAAAIAAVALFKGKPAIKLTKQLTAAGEVKFSFKLKGAALKELKKKKKLKLKVTFTVTPASGAAPSTNSKSITFIK